MAVDVALEPFVDDPKIFKPESRCIGMILNPNESTLDISAAPSQL